MATWNCPDCQEELSDAILTCWRCGGLREEDPQSAAFPAFRDAEKLQRESEVMRQRQTRRFARQISLREILGVMMLFAVIFTLMRSFGEAGLTLFAVVMVTNLIGIAVALAVTYVGGLPNDGSL